MLNRKELISYMETVISELEDITVEEGSNKQAFKTMIKMTSRLRFVKIHLVNVVINQPDKYKVLYESVLNDELQINAYRGILGLPPIDFK